jgi:5-methylcytosine-specific restriction enzyme subunit McrC
MMSVTTQAAADTPTTASGIPIRNLWYMLIYAWNELWMKSHMVAEIEAAPSLDALLATVLAKLMQQRLRIGLGRNYRNDDGLIRGIRGRVDFATSLKRLAFQQGQAHCRFQTYSSNVPKNQVVRATLHRLALTGVFGPDRSQAESLRHRLRQLVRTLNTIDLIDPTPEFIRRQRLQRHDADYRLMLAICQLVSGRLMPTEAEGTHDLPGLDRDEITLWRVFERFVANFYSTHLVGWKVTRQAGLSWHETKGSQFLPGMAADLLLREVVSGRIIVLDTKFTAKILTPGRWDNLTFNRDHLFQLYAYLRSQEDVSAQHRCAAGVLLYPTVKHSLSESVELQGHRICWETVDLSQDWKCIEHNLLEIASPVFRGLARPSQTTLSRSVDVESSD